MDSYVFAEKQLYKNTYYHDEDFTLANFLITPFTKFKFIRIEGTIMRKRLILLALSIFMNSEYILAQSAKKVVWEDHFDGFGQPNPENWNYHVGNGYNIGQFIGWGNGEWEWYRPENAYLQNGNLVIRADYYDSPTIIAGRSWYQRSARITTQGKKSWTYGRIEARIAMPKAMGSWPAFWMLGDACDDSYTSSYNVAMEHYDTMATNWSSCGEIDIMEHANNDTTTTQNAFWDTRTTLEPWSGDTIASYSNAAEAGDVSYFHIYAIEWDPKHIRWFIDDRQVHSLNIEASNKEELHRPFHIIINIALAGSYTGNTPPQKADFPLYMYVDYVRVSQ